ncbi:hypothetical protein BV22DRAFT_221794 [Leucogyrophana mollusca]|uniref:Uncharacterized protein n=1 Tax=Leucogyrophana mollusca TaxID=85980 RepID=A0ACB8BSA1_9AGAM|nr:hypothetical protein BV22DRAFT_221794 [Leucogyrophana mollusca]
MGSVQAELYKFQSYNYMTMASAAVVLYDQILNFSQEVDLIWNRRWSITTALYFTARYSGSASIFVYISLYLRLNWSLMVIRSMELAFQWLGTVFTAAMQAILLMRAYVLCNRSRMVLVFLLVLYFCQTIGAVAIGGIIFNISSIGKYLLSVGPAIGSVVEDDGVDEYVLQPLLMIALIMQMAFDLILLIVVLVAFLKHALEARRLDGGWSMSPLIKALVADQTLYFVWFAVWQSTSISEALPNSAAAQSVIFGGITNIFSALAILAGPRVVISLRAQEAKTREGTLQEELSTIQFGTRDPPSQSAGEGEPELLVDHGRHLAPRRRAAKMEA